MEKLQAEWEEGRMGERESGRDWEWESGRRDEEVKR